jgi:hypothetical protein
MVKGDVTLVLGPLAERGVEQKDSKDLGEGLGIYVLAFRDPDNIALELTAPYSRP